MLATRRRSPQSRPADDTHHGVSDRDLDLDRTNGGRLRRCPVATIVLTPRSSPAQTLARRYRPRVTAIACLCGDVAAVPDPRSTDRVGAAFPAS